MRVKRSLKPQVGKKIKDEGILIPSRYVFEKIPTKSIKYQDQNTDVESILSKGNKSENNSNLKLVRLRDLSSLEFVSWEELINDGGYGVYPYGYDGYPYSITITIKSLKHYKQFLSLINKHQFRSLPKKQQSTKLFGNKIKSIEKMTLTFKEFKSDSYSIVFFATMPVRSFKLEKIKVKCIKTDEVKITNNDQERSPFYDDNEEPNLLINDILFLSGYISMNLSLAIEKIYRNNRNKSLNAKIQEND